MELTIIQSLILIKLLYRHNNLYGITTVAFEIFEKNLKNYSSFNSPHYPSTIFPLSKP